MIKFDAHVRDLVQPHIASTDDSPRLTSSFLQARRTLASFHRTSPSLLQHPLRSTRCIEG